MNRNRMKTTFRLKNLTMCLSHDFSEILIAIPNQRDAFISQASSNGFTDPILTKRLPSLHPAALISDQYPALCRLPYSRYSLSNDFDTLVLERSLYIGIDLAIVTCNPTRWRMTKGDYSCAIFYSFVSIHQSRVEQEY